MSNPKTAGEWRSAAAQIKDQIKQNDVEAASLRSTRAGLVKQQEALAKRRDTYPYGSSGWLSVQSDILQIGEQIVRIDNDLSEIARENQLLTQQYNDALAQATLAEEGPPDTNTVPPPATDIPGSNTQPDPLPDLNTPLTEPEDPDPTEYDEFAGLDTAIEAQQGGLEEPLLLTTEETDAYLQAGGEQELIDLNAALTEPPDPDPGEYDEFAGLDQAIANQEGLQEPPLLTDEEAEAYLQGGGEQPDFTDEESPQGSGYGILGGKSDTQAQATAQDLNNFYSTGDWRVKLKLAPSATYLYKAADPGILGPLQESDGVIFPYTPTISVNYTASYDAQDLVHSNYKIYQYKNSSVDTVTITCDFTAQDVGEANYLLAVIHFFRSCTKMFYGQDQNPGPGVPPPLCYLFGLGSYQFDNHPLVITGFTYSLPNDVDYIRAGSPVTTGGTNLAGYRQGNNSQSLPGTRLDQAGLAPGGTAQAPKFQILTTKEPTYVPTKMAMTITCAPVVSRNDISNKFSLKGYATGALLRGSKIPGGGIW